MALRLARLDDTTRSAFEVFQHEVWQPDWSADLEACVMRWRFREHPMGEAWLAMDGERCVAAIDSVLRPYMYNGSRMVVRETANWFCLEKHRPSGIGLSLLRKMMQGAEPILVVGATDATVKILPRLHWQQGPSAIHYVYAAKMRGFIAAALRAKNPAYESAANFFPRFIPFGKPIRSVIPRVGAEVRQLRRNDPLPAIDTVPDGLIQLLDDAQWRWIADMPLALGETIGLVFSVAGSDVGLTVSQTEPTVGMGARILHAQIGDIDQSVANWIMAQTTRHLITQGAEFIRCRTCVGRVSTALDAVGFSVRHVLPSFWWSRTLPSPNALEVGYLRGDEAMPFRSGR